MFIEGEEIQDPNISEAEKGALIRAALSELENSVIIRENQPLIQTLGEIDRKSTRLNSSHWE